jgi:hypothetical protein
MQIHGTAQQLIGQTGVAAAPGTGAEFLRLVNQGK